MDPSTIPFAHAGSLVIGLLLVAAAVGWPNAARALFALLFLWAGQYNFRIALIRPEEYQGYAPYALLAFYREFILGFFSRYTTPIVDAIAIGQLIVAVLLTLRDPLVKVGIFGGVLFLVAVAPLGVGAAFPATLVMAVGLALLWRRDFPATLWGLAARRLHLRHA